MLNKLKGLIRIKVTYSVLRNKCIYIIKKAKPQTSDYLSQRFTISSFKTDSWTVLSSIEREIKQKIEKIGKPLKDWDINIYRGILTGYNEAFIIDQETRDKLVAASSKNAEIIRPILRGRDIKSYSFKFANQYIINSHNGIKSKNIPRINVKDYNSIYNHLCLYQEQLMSRLDKGDHWTNLRNCAYLEEFTKEKLIWLELTDKPNFAFDTNGYYINNTIFFMTGSRLKYLMAFLNSRICEWYFDKIAATSGVGTRRWIKIYMDQLCVPIPNKAFEKSINELVDKVLSNPLSESLRIDIEKKFYEVFKFDENEINFIKNSNL